MSEFEKNIIKIAVNATKKAQEDNLKKGIANVYSKNGHIYFQLPDGSITQEEPKIYSELKL
jgi:hypothetical protein